MKADLRFSHSPALEGKKKSHSKNHVGWAQCCKHLVNYGKNHLIATKSRHHVCSKSPNNIQGAKMGEIIGGVSVWARPQIAFQGRDLQINLEPNCKAANWICRSLKTNDGKQRAGCRGL